MQLGQKKAKQGEFKIMRRLGALALHSARESCTPNIPSRVRSNYLSSRTSEELNYCFESGVYRKDERCVCVYAGLIIEARRRGLHDDYDVGGMQALVMLVGYVDFG